MAGRGRSATHARAKGASKKQKRTRVDADAGVRECMRLMAAGKWVPGASHQDVAFAHGVSPATVKDWATSASRVLRIATDQETEDLRAELLTTLATVRSRVLSSRKPDFKAAIMAIAESGKLLGLQSQRIDVVNHRVAHLSRDEHAAELKKLQADIDDELAALAKEPR